jgi:hypothetical protein
MVKKAAVILGILAVVVMSAGISWGYTVSRWPVPGIPTLTWGDGSACLVNPQEVTLMGPVAPSCHAPLIPGAIHAGLSLPFRVLGVVATPLFNGGRPGAECCKIELGDPAYVTAAVPCTPVNAYVPPRGW